MSKIIDLSYLNEISGGDSSFIKEMLELYINTTATEADLYTEMLNSRDYEGIGHLAHKMKAPIQMLGANELFQTIRNLEHYGKEGSHLDEMPQLIDKVKSLVAESIVEIRGILDTL
ncbi:MAG: Hpt domain-containing protein [Bacteroidia bacterium]|nr:Hpt domain-containing protein [Bacteroidia bacterium]MCF8425428.1 Hpt domain-containing protein [Bacteroidia bacterium]MCF8447214.1 Hpt domain-containing protein [Bacteroidia bacterium]